MFKRLSVVFLFALFSFSFSSALLFSDYSAGSYVNSPFAPPQDVFSSNANIFTLSQERFSGISDSSKVSFIANVNQEGSFIWKTGYWYNQDSNSWQSFTFSGEKAKTSQGTSNDWINSSASANLDLQGQDLSLGANFVVAYICKKYNNSWKCGCASADNSSSCRRWSLQIFNVSGSVPNRGSGNNFLINGSSSSQQNLSCSKNNFATANACDAQNGCSAVMTSCSNLDESACVLNSACSPKYQGSQSSCDYPWPSLDVCLSRQSCAVVSNEDGSYRQCDGIYNLFSSCDGSYYYDCLADEDFEQLFNPNLNPTSGYYHITALDPAEDFVYTAGEFRSETKHLILIDVNFPSRIGIGPIDYSPNIYSEETYLSWPNGSFEFGSWVRGSPTDVSTSQCTISSQCGYPNKCINGACSLPECTIDSHCMDSNKQCQNYQCVLINNDPCYGKSAGEQCNDGSWVADISGGVVTISANSSYQSGGVSYSQAQAACNGLTLGSFAWQLPTLNQLIALETNLSRNSKSSPWITNYYWSSNVNSINGNHYTVGFNSYSGQINSLASDGSPRAYRCVRAASALW